MDAPNTRHGSVEPTASGQSDLTVRVDRARLVADALALAAVPLAMLGVFALPTGVKRAYAFSYADPTVLTAFTAHYVHLTPEHLAGNLVGFLLLASVGYGLSLAAGRRRLFFAATATFLTAFPFVLSGLNLAIPRDAIGFGFSGINMALFGYVAVALVTVVDDRFGVDARRYLPALFLVSAGYVALIALPMSIVSVGVAAATVVVAVAYGRAVGPRSGRSLRRTAGRVAETPVYGELVVVAAVVLVGYPFVGFPTPTPDGPRVNLYVHFLGYALAYTTVHLSLLADQSGSLWGPTDAQ